jgi:MarR family transcriptional regulator, organic hydroperoxide resistance regulator
MQSNREGSFGFPAVPAMGPVLEFMRVVWALDHALQKTSKRMEMTLGITAPQRLVIRILGRFPGMSAGLLAIILRLHPSTLTGVLKRLQRRGLITRRADPRDRRRAVFGLTARGRALDVNAEGTVEAAVRATFEELPKTKIKDATEVFQKLADLLESRNSRTS